MNVGQPAENMRSRRRQPRGPIVVVGLVAYGLVSLALPLGVILKPALGEVADVVQMIGFLWPYPLLLSLQGVVPIEGPGAWFAYVLIVGLGLAIVWVFTASTQARLGHETWSNPRAYVWAPWLWVAPLIALQAVVYGLGLAQ